MGLFEEQYPPRPPLPTMRDLPGIHQPIQANGLLSMSPPHAAALPAAPQRQSLWDRVQGVLMPRSSGPAGLLDDEQLHHARQQGLLQAGLHMLGASRGQDGGNAPSTLQALAGGIQAGQAGFQGNAEQQIAAQQLKQQQDAQRTLIQKRGAIAAQFPPAPNETPPMQVQRLMKMYTAYAQAGDTEMAGKLGEVLKSMGDVINGPKPSDLQHTDLGDRVEFTDPHTGRVIRTVKKGLTPKTPAEVDASTRFQADQGNKILDDYARDTKDFHQVMAGWDVLVGATKDPTLATPFAITDAYARITNPGGIVRPTTMEMIDKMGSVGQRMKKWWEHNANGALPPDIMKDFQKTLYNIVNEHKKQYDQIRSKAIVRGNRAGTDVAPLLEDYHIEDPLAPPGGNIGGAAAHARARAGNSSNVRQFLKPN